MATSSENIRVLLDDLFRKEAGQIVATLTRFLGTDQLDLAESMMQEAWIKALQSWPLSGVPDRPGAWLITAAKNAAIDHIRKDGHFEKNRNSLIHELTSDNDGSAADEVVFATELADDQLRMLFTCCHPCLSPASQIALTLKVLCGFGVPEISRAFLVDWKTVEQRIVRAKKKIRDAGIRYEIPTDEEIPERMESVLNILYAVFNEGYSATDGDQLIKRELCYEAMRLGRSLAKNRHGSQCPSLHALLALMCCQASRLDARMDDEQNIILLEDQDRGRWDYGLVREGLAFLSRAAAGDQLSRYHIEAGIAACHSIARSFGETRWDLIHQYYSDLMSLCPTPIIALNKAIALAMAFGLDKGIKELKQLEAIPQLKGYHLYHATLADLYRQSGRYRKALECYQEALSTTNNLIEAKFIRKRIEEVSQHV